MQKYKSNITTTSGAAVRGVPVLVIDKDGNNAALFLDRAGTVPAQNPLTTGPDGVFYFYAVNGRYSLRTTVDGVTITDDDVVLMMDPEEITVAGPIAEAVAAAQAAATAAEFAVEASGIPDLVAAAQNAVVDSNNAVTQATSAANNAAISKTGADSARDDAVIAKNAAEAALDSFAARYLGAKAVAPTTDNDGGALLPGALYWDTVIGAMRAWSGSVWVTLPATTAAAISNTPAGSIAATTLQAAINELDAKKANLASPNFIGNVLAESSPASVGISALQGANSGYESRAKSTGGNAGAATIAFHRQDSHAVHFGLDTDNKLKVGGWSLGANAYSIYHENNKPTKADVGLGNVDNTSDAAKPVSTAQATALALKANTASPTLTGTPAAPTAAAGTNTTQLATTAYALAAAAARYGKNNILGTVSQSAGVPTGALLESGTSVTGAYWRFASGLQIATGTAPTGTASGAFGAVFGSAGVTATYAAAFSSPPKVAPTAVASTGWVLALADNNTQVTLFAVCPVSGSTITPQYIAVGFWF